MHLLQGLLAVGGIEQRVAGLGATGAVALGLGGQHALLQCDGLIPWNDTFYRDYFKGLKLIVPQA